MANSSFNNLQQPKKQAEISVNRLILIGLLTRLVTDTAVQLFFPFLPVIAEGLRTTTVTAGRLVSLRSAMGLLSPVFGYQAYLRGNQTIMRFGLLLAAVGYLIVGASQHVALAAVGMVLGGLGTFAFIPILQAYLSARLPFHRRARGLGMLEYAWALSGIVGLFLVGLLIEARGWRAPLFLLSGLFMVAFVGYGRLPAAGSRPPEVRQEPFNWNFIRNFFELGRNRLSASMALVVIFGTMMAAMNVFISYGAWLNREYGLGAAQLGTVALALGLADLGGSVLMSLIGDRVGLRRGVLVGAIAATLGYGLLPVLNQGIALAVCGLLLARFAFEFTLVGLIALISEQAPAYRGKMMTLAAASALAGSSVAGFIGPWVYETFRVLGLSFISVTLMGITLFLLAYFVRERGEEA